MQSSARCQCSCSDQGLLQGWRSPCGARTLSSASGMLRCVCTTHAEAAEPLSMPGICTFPCLCHTVPAMGALSQRAQVAALWDELHTRQPWINALKTETGINLDSLSTSNQSTRGLAVLGINTVRLPAALASPPRHDSLASEWGPAPQAHLPWAQPTRQVTQQAPLPLRMEPPCRRRSAGMARCGAAAAARLRSRNQDKTLPSALHTKTLQCMRPCNSAKLPQKKTKQPPALPETGLPCQRRGCVAGPGRAGEAGQPAQHLGAHGGHHAHA